MASSPADEDQQKPFGSDSDQMDDDGESGDGVREKRQNIFGAIIEGLVEGAVAGSIINAYRPGGYYGK